MYHFRIRHSPGRIQRGGVAINDLVAEAVLIKVTLLRRARGRFVCSQVLSHQLMPCQFHHIRGRYQVVAFLQLVKPP